MACCFVGLLTTHAVVMGQARDLGAESRRQFDSARSLAVVVGISDYRDSVLQLRAAANDARRLAELLEDQSLTGGHQVTLLTDSAATAQAIKRAVLDMARNAGPDGRIVFFFSGHGALDSRGRLCLLPAGAARDYVDTDSLCLRDDILRHISESQAKNRLVVLDACHSGQVSRDLLGTKAAPEPLHPDRERDLGILSGSGTYVLVSSKGYSYEEGSGQHGYFTRALLGGIRGAADSTRPSGNQDGLVTVKELADYVAYAADDAAYRDRGVHQQSTLNAIDVSGELFLARTGEGGGWPTVLEGGLERLTISPGRDGLETKALVEIVRSGNVVGQAFVTAVKRDRAEAFLVTPTPVIAGDLVRVVGRLRTASERLSLRTSTTESSAAQRSEAQGIATSEPVEVLLRKAAFCRAMKQYLDEKGEGGAVPLYRRVLEVDPENAKAARALQDIRAELFQQARAYAREQSYAMAKRVLERTLKVIPGDEEVTAFLGRVTLMETDVSEYVRFKEAYDEEVKRGRHDEAGSR